MKKKENFLHTNTKWRKLRKRKLEASGYVCNECGCAVRRLECDHIIPISAGGNFFGLDNLQILCVLCHRLKTAKEHRIYRPNQRKGIPRRRLSCGK